MPDYNFSQFLKNDKDNDKNNSKLSSEQAKDPNHAFTREEVRTGLRVTKCCGNCKYFWYEAERNNSSRRGYCKQPYKTKKENPALNKYGKVLVDLAKQHWLKTHCTLVCDLHEQKSLIYSHDYVSKWIRHPINEDGTIPDEEYIEDKAEKTNEDYDGFDF